MWIDDKEYKKNQSQYKDYSIANGAVTNYQSSTNCPQCASVSQGQWIQLNANGTISHVADPTMTIRAQYDEELEDNRLYVRLGMTRSGEANPLFGPPGRSSTIHYKNGGGQTRHFDDKGKPWVDIDWGHHPELGPSHVHWWDPDKDPRSEGARR